MEAARQRHPSGRDPRLNVERGKACLAAGADIVSVVTDVTLTPSRRPRPPVDRTTRAL